MPEQARLFLKGMAMGAANVIPGVSGGTVAFVTNIYERLILSLKSFDLEALRFLASFRLRDFGAKVSFSFLLPVLLGVAVSIVSFAKALALAFEHYETLTLSFFFGLILASVLSVGKEVSPWNPASTGTFLIGLSIAFSVAFLPPATPDEGFLYLILCGMAAICSMILPGLSGSYVLLLMGNYVLVLQAISSLRMAVLVPIFIGCMVGIVAFSRLLFYLFSHYKNITVSLLTGFVAGSLIIIWPWKITEKEEIMEGKIKAVGYSWQLPPLDQSFLFSVLLIAAGFLTVYLMDKASRVSN